MELKSVYCVPVRFLQCSTALAVQVVNERIGAHLFFSTAGKD